MGLDRPDSFELPLLGAYEVSFSLNRFVKFIGPGLLMSIAYVDPGNLESDLQVGANAGYALLWVLLWCTVLGYVVQMQAAKLGVVTGKHLAEHCSQGAIPLWAGVLLSVIVSFAMLLVERFGVIKGFVTPTVPRPNIGQAVALVGSLIMPHNIYLHSALVMSRPLQRNDEQHKREALVYYGIESGMSLLVSVFINMFVTGVFAAGFYGQALQDIGLENAGQYLGRTYGPAMVYIWALGLLAAGQSSTMTGTYTGQFVMTGYLKLKVSPWLRILITRSVALIPALVVSILTRNSSSSTALDQLNQWLNLLQSVQLPFALIPVLAFNASEALMGKKFANSGLMVVVTVLISLLVMFVNVAGVMAFTEAALDGAGMLAWGLFGVVMSVYLFLVAFVFIHATAAAGVLPAAARFIAAVPGGGDGSSIGGGAFRRVPSRPTDEDAEAAAAAAAGGVGFGGEGGVGRSVPAGPSGRDNEEGVDLGSGEISGCTCGMERYVKKKKLDALDTYVPLVLEARDRLASLDTVMVREAKAAADKAEKAAKDGAEAAPVDEAVGLDKDTAVSKLQVAVEKLDNLIATVPADVLHQSQKVLEKVNQKQQAVAG
eukprot:gene7643-7845_t